MQVRFLAQYLGAEQMRPGLVRRSNHLDDHFLARIDPGYRIERDLARCDLMAKALGLNRRFPPNGFRGCGP
jgi:hypothetical protein